MLSYWEQSAMLDYDLVVLGGGITGMFCALSYRERYPKARIAILERGLFSVPFPPILTRIRRAFRGHVSPV